jgi:exodeoxyribonuclease VII large subunit
VQGKTKNVIFEALISSFGYAMPDSSAQCAILSVSQLNGQVRQLLEAQIGDVWLQGEISNLAKPYSGHWYFSLKDNQAQVRCAMFKGQNRRVLFDVKDGQQVLVRARISVYEPRGEYQLLVQAMQPDGDGAMQLAFEQLKFKLAAEGLFAEARKRPLAPLAQRVGVITSASGAAFTDITSVLARLAPSIEVVLYPSQVQGEAAPGQLLEALQLANQRNEVDVLIIGRGGGSLEDLWAFNHESLARAVAASHIPIISAVGHEIDVTLCDFVADWRAPTPSAAAEKVAGGITQLGHRLNHLTGRLQQAALTRQSRLQQQLKQLSHRLQMQSPEIRLQQQQQRLDELTQRLERAQQNQHMARRHTLDKLRSRLNLGHLEHRLQEHQTHVSQLNYRLHQSQQQTLSTAQAHLAQLAAQLHALSPLATLTRGYTLVHDDQGHSITEINQLKCQQSVTIQFKDGRAEALVTRVDADE